MEKMESINPAERRRLTAEEEGKLSISHYRGELHSHSKDEPDEMTPEKIAHERLGSNCGQIPLKVLSVYHLESLKNDYLAVTEHSRDGEPDKAMAGVTVWFKNLYLKELDKAEADLTPEDNEKIAEYARRLLHYDDERLIRNNKHLDEVNQEMGGRLIKGVEVSLMPDGSFDSPLAEAGAFDQVNCSIHPEIDEAAFSPIIKDPKKYNALVEKGLSNPRTNIMGHIGKFCPDLDMKDLNWEKFAENAIKNKVAIEINLEDLNKFIIKQIIEKEQSAKDFAGQKKYAEFRAELPSLIPIISDPTIRERLRPYVSQGLKFAVNTDEHKNPHIRQGEDGPEFKRELRYWRALKIVEDYFNELLSDLGAKKENIINTFEFEELKSFLRK